MTQWVTYLQSILMAKAKPQDLLPELLQELRTLCEVLNFFGQGKVQVAADVVVQRFKAVEQEALCRGARATGLELVDTRRAGLVSDSELRISNDEAQAQQLLAGDVAALRDG